jgi:hypothetical protein
MFMRVFIAMVAVLVATPAWAWDDDAVGLEDGYWDRPIPSYSRRDDSQRQLDRTMYQMQQQQMLEQQEDMVKAQKELVEIERERLELQRQALQERQSDFP